MENGGDNNGGFLPFRLPKIIGRKLHDTILKEKDLQLHYCHQSHNLTLKQMDYQMDEVRQHHQEILFERNLRLQALNNSFHLHLQEKDLRLQDLQIIALEKYSRLQDTQIVLVIAVGIMVALIGVIYRLMSCEEKEKHKMNTQYVGIIEEKSIRIKELEKRQQKLEEQLQRAQHLAPEQRLCNPPPHPQQFLYAFPGVQSIQAIATPSIKA